MANINDLDFGSESDDGVEFNPAPGGGSDDEEAHSSPPQTNKPKFSSRSRQDEDIDDEDQDGEDENGDDLEANNDHSDEEEDEDDDDAVTGRPRKRTRRDPRNQFIDIEAEVDEEDEGDEDEDEEDVGGFITKDHPDDLDLPLGTETDDRRHRELDSKREREMQLDAEKQAAMLKERYGRSRPTVTDAALVPKRLLLPSVDDASIWGVRAKPGKEREAVFSILKRVEERAHTKNPMPIISAFERGGTMTGYVYVEARTQADILAALDGIMNIYPRTKMVLVPIKEMPDLLRVKKTEQLQRGAYVRVKRGKYAGDLAWVDEVESNGLDVTLKIVPRLDYGMNEDANGPAIETAKRERGGALKPTGPRPQPRHFSEQEAKKKHGKYLASMSTFDRKHWTYLGDNYVNGFLVKDFKIQHLQTENVHPKLEEVTRFAVGAEDGAENLDLSVLADSLKTTAANGTYLPGDTVEVYEGEQQGVFGKAIAVQGDIVTINVLEGELRGQDIEVPVTGLRKRFREGDHVKVIGGSRFRDEVGMVVRLKDDRVTILSDMSMQEITVFSKDLREASDSGLAGGLGRYDIHDLVQLDPATVGCVTKVDRESLRVLDQNGSVRSVMPSQISNKIEKRRHAVATDRNGSEIRQDDTVREIGGESKQGVIIHIHRSFLFIHNREQTENSGISVVRANNVATVAAKGGRVANASSTGPDLTRMNPALQRNGGAKGGSMPPPKSFGRDLAIGKTVTIRKGPYKGLLGIIKDTTDSEARIELHTKNKTIQISKDVLSFKHPITGVSMDYNDFTGRGRGGGGRGGFGGSTPSRGSDSGWSGSRTPMATGNGGRTPAWGQQSSRTPAWQANNASTSRTPRWGQEAGGRTPAWGQDGSRTAYGDLGGRTPAWNAGGRTAYGGQTTTASDPFGGSKTPAYNDSSRTPAHASSYNSNSDPWNRPQDAPTPAAAAAPTPSNPYSAPTPSASAPTPKYSGYAMDAPTPGGAPTPFSGNPETPGWGGDDDGPRYDESPSP